MNVVREPNAALQGLRTNIAPVSASIRVITKGAVASRAGPSTHSM